MQFEVDVLGDDDAAEVLVDIDDPDGAHWRTGFPNRPAGRANRNTSTSPV